MSILQTGLTCSALTLLLPFSPFSPGCPGRPGWPGWPLEPPSPGKPRSPGGPGGPGAPGDPGLLWHLVQPLCWLLSNNKGSSAMMISRGKSSDVCWKEKKHTHRETCHQCVCSITHRGGSLCRSAGCGCPTFHSPGIKSDSDRPSQRVSDMTLWNSHDEHKRCVQYTYRSSFRSRLARWTCVPRRTPGASWTGLSRLTRLSRVTFLTWLPRIPCCPFLAKKQSQC